MLAYELLPGGPLCYGGNWNHVVIWYYNGRCPGKGSLADKMKLWGKVIPVLVVAVIASLFVAYVVCCCHFCNKNEKGDKSSQPQSNLVRIQPTSKSISSLPDQQTSVPVKTLPKTDVVGQPPPAKYLPPPTPEYLKTS